MASQISIGFHASPPLSLRVSAEELDKLRAALSGSGWHQLEGLDGTLELNLEHILWLRVEKEEQRIGFGA